MPSRRDMHPCCTSLVRCCFSVNICLSHLSHGFGRRSLRRLARPSFWLLREPFTALIWRGALGSTPSLRALRSIRPPPMGKRCLAPTLHVHPSARLLQTHRPLVRRDAREGCGPASNVVRLLLSISRKSRAVRPSKMSASKVVRVFPRSCRCSRAVRSSKASS